MPAPDAKPLFDLTIHLGDVLTFLAAAYVGIRIFLMMRDQLRDVVNAIGSKYPRNGLLGDMENIKEDVQEHREWMLSEGFDRRHAERRDSRDSHN